MMDLLDEIDTYLFGILPSEWCLLFDIFAKINFVMMMILFFVVLYLMLFVGFALPAIMTTVYLMIVLFLNYLQNRLLYNMCKRSNSSGDLQSPSELVVKRLRGTLAPLPITEGFDPDPPILDPSAQFDRISTLKETSIKLGEKREELSNITAIPTTPAPTTAPTTSLPMKHTTTPPSPTVSATTHPTISILPMLSTPTPTPAVTTVPTTVQPTYTSTSTPSSNIIYTPAPCGFSTSHNKHLQSAYDSLHKYDISGASTALNKEIVRRSVYVERLQPNSSKEVKSYNMDIIAKLNTVLKDLENDTPNLADDLNTICMIKPFQQNTI
jgi:hypothetical protein